jgi:hypothetical protein
LSIAIQYAESDRVSPHLFARRYSPVEETFAIKTSDEPLLTNDGVDQNVAVVLKNPAI